MLLRQSMYSRLAGYEDTNDGVRLALTRFRNSQGALERGLDAAASAKDAPSALQGSQVA